MQRSLRIAIVLAAVVLVALLARRALRAWPAGNTAADAAPDLFTYRAEVELGASAAVAADLTGPLGLTRRDVDGACEGERPAIELLVERIAARWPASATDATEVENAIASLPEQCFEPPSPPGMCAWAAGEIERGGDLSRAAWAILTDCPPGVASPFFDRADAPATQIIAFVSRRHVGSPWLRPPPRLPSQYARAVLELASQPELDATLLVSTTTAFAVRYDDPAATEVLVRAYESAPDPARRLVVARAMGVLSNARATAITQTACASVPTLPGCPGAAALESMELLYDAASYVERHPAERPRVEGELEGCARGASTALVGIPSMCLARLATIDWARARTVAPAVDAHSDPALAGVAASLARFPSANDLVLALRTRQLLGEPRASEAAPVTVVAAMASYGRGWMLGRASLVAFGHDRLARHLLRLGELDDVEVDEHNVQGTTGLASLGMSTRLRATSRGDTFFVDTASDGDYYDLDAIVGLLNVVARARAANVRYLVVLDPLAEEAIVLGPPGELASAVAEGLLVVPGADSTTPMLPF